MSGWIVLFLVGARAMADLKRELAEKAPSLASTYGPLLRGQPNGGPFVICRSMPGSLDVSLFDSLGRTLCGEGFYAFGSPGGSPVEVLEALKGHPAYGSGYSPSNRKEYAIAYPIKESESIVGVVRLSRTLAEVEEIRRNTYLKIMWVAVSFILFSIVVNLFFSNTSNRRSYA